jgi:hypothetical protein
MTMIIFGHLKIETAACWDLGQLLLNIFHP